MDQQSTAICVLCGTGGGQHSMNCQFHPDRQSPRLEPLPSQSEIIRTRAAQITALRDQFAMAGLAASMNHGGSDPVKWAENAYRLADAMLAARKPK